MAFPAASRRCRNRFRSSGCIERPSGGSDVVAEVGAEVFRCAQLDLAAEGVFEFQLNLGEVEQAGGVSGLELDQDADIAVRAEVRAKRRAVQGEAADAVSGSERSQEGVVDRQAERSSTRPSCRRHTIDGRCSRSH
jgi:hypothetical protein